MKNFYDRNVVEQTIIETRAELATLDDIEDRERIAGLRTLLLCLHRIKELQTH